MKARAAACHFGTQSMLPLTSARCGAPRPFRVDTSRLCSIPAPQARRSNEQGRKFVHLDPSTEAGMFVQQSRAWPTSTLSTANAIFSF